MKSRPFSTTALKVIALALTILGIAELTTGCASGPGSKNAGSTAALPIDTNGVQGRDQGEGGATSGGVSSLDPRGNAADWSMYDAHQIER